MIGDDLERVTPGRPISARAINRWQAEQERLARRRREPGRGGRGFWARLSGSASPYGVQEVWGKVVAGALSWTDAAAGRACAACGHEANAAAGLNGMVAWVERGNDPASYVFAYPRKGTSPTGVVATGCPCSGGFAGTTPVTVYMHRSGGADDNFRDATLAYGATSSEYATLSVGANNWYSTASFYDASDTGHQFPWQYLFRCESGLYVVRKIFPATTGSPFSGVGTAFLGSVLYRWAIGGSNHCQGGSGGTTFQLLTGVIYTGGNPATVVTVDTTP